MKPEQLRYDQETATRYSDPPSTLTFERPTLHVVDQYAALLKLRAEVKGIHTDLITAGVFQSIPTLTEETKNGRPGTYWRAVFRTNSPEVLHGNARKHYIGSDNANLEEWTLWIKRTRLAIDLNKLIHDIGMTLKDIARTINTQGDFLTRRGRTHRQRLEELCP